MVQHVDLNIFRVLGDASHALSKCILIWAIDRNRSAEGVSLITQALYLVVFAVRYADIFWVSISFSYWNFVLKIFYITSSAGIVLLMLRVYARTREREKSWRLGAYSLAGSLVAAPIITFIYEGKPKEGQNYFFEILYVFTLVLEAFCILPQLVLLRQTSVPTVIDSYYLVALGSYRFWYILNWILRAAKQDYLGPTYPVSFTFGIIQTLFYFDFAWVYYSRQRVKLRRGGVVDKEDFNRGWLVNRIIGHKHVAGDEDGNGEENERLAGQEEGRHTRRWGARGISVSADEDPFESDHDEDNRPAAYGNRQGLTDPAAFEDEEDDERDLALPPSQVQHDTISSSTEWRKD